MSFGKKRIYLLIIIIFGSLLAAGYIFAQSYGLEEAAKTSRLTENAISKAGDIPAMIGVIVATVLSLVGVYFFILILYGGFVWMTAAGSTEKVETAKKKITSAVIGLVIVLSAYTLTRFIFDTLLQEPGATLSCKATPDGVRAAECGQNMVCLKGKCAPECDYLYGNPDRNFGGKCVNITTDSCEEGRLFSYCPGNMKCCVPLTGLAEFEKQQAAQPSGGAAPVIVPEKTACEKQEGNFCAAKSDCEGTWNGKALTQSGCPTGEICCKSCTGGLGGTCIDTTFETCEGSAKNLKPGYCFGIYKDRNEIQCCIGRYSSLIPK